MAVNVEIDTRPIWVLLALKAVRPFFFAALAAGFYLAINLPAAQGLTVAGQRAIAIFLLCIVLWLTNAVPLAITSLFAMVLVPLLGVLSKKETYSLFGSESVFFILGAFILAGAIMHSGLSNRIALNIMGRFGNSPKRLLLSIFLLATFLSFFMSEHAVAAMLFPIVLEVAKGLGLRPGKSNYGKLLFFALAWGCIIGGVGTFLGGARVPLAVGMLKESTGITISFLDYTIAVFPLVVVMFVAAYFLLTVYYPIDITGVESAHAVIEKKLKGLGKVNFNEYAVGLVLALTVIAWMVAGRYLGLAAIALASVVVIFALRLVKWNDVEEYVNWGIILMYGGAIVLGSALDKSGAAKWIIDGAIGKWAGNPWTVFAIFSLLSMLLTEAMSHAAVVAILMPVSIGIASRVAMDPSLMAYSIAVPAGLAFMLPMSTPANALAVSSSHVAVKDLAKGGFIMCLIAWVAFNLLAAFYWPLIGMGSAR